MTSELIATLIGAGIALAGGFLGAFLQHFLSLRADKIRRERDREELEKKERRQNLLTGVPELTREFVLREERAGVAREVRLRSERARVMVEMEGAGLSKEQWDLMRQQLYEQDRELALEVMKQLELMGKPNQLNDGTEPPPA